MVKRTSSEIQGILNDVDSGMGEIVRKIPESEFQRNYLPILSNIYNADSNQLDMRLWIDRVGGHNRTAQIVSDTNHDEVLFVTPPYFPKVTLVPSANPYNEVTKAKRNERVDPNAHLKATNRIFDENSKMIIGDSKIRDQWDAIFRRYGIVLENQVVSPSAPQEVSDGLDVEWL